MSLSPQKLARIEQTVTAMAVRIERLGAVRGARADSGWDEAQHPRAPNGQFGSGDASGAAHASPHSAALPFYENDFSDTGKLNARRKEGNRDLTELPFPGDTVVGKVLDAATAKNKDWLFDTIDQPLQDVPVKDLVAMQPTMDEAQIDKYRTGEEDNDPFNMIGVRYGGKIYIRNGTHRTVARMQNGENTIPFKVFDAGGP